MPTVSDVRSLLPLKAGWLPMDLTLICRIITRLLIYNLTVAKDFEQVSNEEVYQLLLGCRETDYSAILKDVDGAKIAAWWDRAVDIIPANGGKGIGIQKVLEYYHLDKSEASPLVTGTMILKCSSL